MNLIVDLSDMHTTGDLDEALNRVALLVTTLNPKPTESRTTGEH